MRPSPRVIGGLAVAIVAFVTVTVAVAEIPRELTFCAGAGNMPLSGGGSRPGFEVEWARAVAARLGAKARFAWLETHRESFEQAVLDNRCDAALGTILDPGTLAGERLMPGVAPTVPYFSAGYALVRRADSEPIRTLAEIGDARIAVAKESIAPFALRQRGHKVHVLDSHRAVIDAVAEGRVGYGYLWGPRASWLLRGRSDVVLAREFVPIDRWRFALTVREAGRDLLDALNTAIGQLSRDGVTADLLTSYGIPDLGVAAPL